MRDTLAQIAEGTPIDRTGLVAAVVSMILVSSSHASSAVDPHADKQTKDTLVYLSSINARDTHKIIFGQFAASAACCSDTETTDDGFRINIESIASAAHLVPGMIGVDYNDYNRVNPTEDVKYSYLNRRVIAYAHAGSLITIGYHAKNPWTDGPWNDGRCPGSFDDLINPEKSVGAKWAMQLDNVAKGLAELQSAGVTVLWRPFLEMNAASGWWWQSCHPSPDQFRSVWKNMFDYFTQTKGLHNLLWVYGAVTQVGSNRPPLELYPGGELVDVAGYDTYHDYADWPDYHSWVGLGKVLAYTERGPHSTDGRSQLYTHLVPDILHNDWKLAFVQTWSGSFNPINNTGGVSMIESPLVANQADVKLVMDCMKRTASVLQAQACVMQ